MTISNSWHRYIITVNGIRYRFTTTAFTTDRAAEKAGVSLEQIEPASMIDFDTLPKWKADK